MSSDKRANILIVAESIDVEDSSGSKANVALIQNLKKVGFKVMVYHYTRKEIQLEGIPCVAIKEKRKSGLFFLSRTERYIRKYFNISLNKPLEKIFGFSFTLFNDRNSIVAALKKIDIEKFDLVMTLSKGGSFRPHHALLKLPHWHPKWLAYIHDPYPFSCYPRPYDWVEPGNSKKRNFFIKVSEKAKYIGYPSKLLEEWMQSYFPVLKGKTVIIPHQIYMEDFKVEAELPSYFKKDDFTIVHAGNLLSARNPSALIAAFFNFLEQHPRAKPHCQLLFLGDRSIYSEKFEKIQKENPQFFATNAYVPFTTVLNIQKNASVNVILEAKGPISPFLPGKFPHCIAAGKPILLLGPYYSESRRLLGADYPYWSEIDDVEEINALIAEIYLKWNKNRLLELNRPDLERYLSQEHLRELINNLFNE